MGQTPDQTPLIPKKETTQPEEKSPITRPIIKIGRSQLEKPSLPQYLTVALAIYKAGNRKMRALEIANQVKVMFPYYSTLTNQELNRYSRNISSIANYKIAGKTCLRVFNKTVVSNYEVYLQVNSNLALDLHHWFLAKSRRDTSRWMQNPTAFRDLIREIYSNAATLPKPMTDVTPKQESKAILDDFSTGLDYLVENEKMPKELDSSFFYWDDLGSVALSQEADNFTPPKQPKRKQPMKSARRSMSFVAHPYGRFAPSPPRECTVYEFGLSFNWKEINSNFEKFFLELLDGDTRAISTSTREYNMLSPLYKRHAALFEGNYPKWERGFGPTVDLSKFASINEEILDDQKKISEESPITLSFSKDESPKLVAYFEEGSHLSLKEQHQIVPSSSQILHQGSFDSSAF